MTAILKPEDLPAPDTLITYADGSVGALMFHYLTEGMNAGHVATQEGFECQYKTMYDELREDDPIYRDYFDGDGNRWRKEWNPEPPAGWQLGAKYDTEDGPMAMFIRKKT